MITPYVLISIIRINFKIGNHMINAYILINIKPYADGEEIIKLFEYELMFVKFEGKKLPVMCSQKGYTVHDDTKRKITKR